MALKRRQILIPIIAEVALPTECEMPVGIAIDGAKVWYVSTKRGLLGSYDTAAGTFNEYEIPSWPTRSLPFTAVPSWSMSWTVKLMEGRKYLVHRPKQYNLAV